MATIGIIVNPHSKANKANPQKIKDLEEFAKNWSIFRKTNSLDELGLVIHEFKSLNPSIVAINGGDGTVSQTISKIIDIYKDTPLPKIALLRGGTMNMLADNLNIKGSSMTLLTKLYQTALSGAQPCQHTTNLNCLKIEGKYGFLFATHTAANFLKVFYNNKTNSLGVLRILAHCFFSLLLRSEFYKRIIEHSNLSLQIPDAPDLVCSRSLGVFCSSVGKLPMGIPFFGFAKAKPGTFRFSSINIPLTKLPFALISLLINRKKKHAYETKGVCRSIRICDIKRIQYTIDGELYESKNASIEIKCGPKVDFILL